MYGGLMRLATGPEGERGRRGEKGPASEIGRRGRQRVDERGVAGAEPIDQCIVSRPMTKERCLFLFVHWLRATLPNV